MMKYFDIACNLSSQRFDGKRDFVIKHALENNVKKIAIICSSIQEVERIHNLNLRFKDTTCFTIGTHPHYANQFSEKDINELNLLCQKYQPDAIGETGLDFFRNLSSVNEQKFAFQEQIKIAIEFNLPLFLHQRDAHEPFLEILDEYISEIDKGVVHCFTGTKKQLFDYLDRGLWIGLTGWICDHRRNKALRSAIKHIPLDKLMIETDCPYLIPKNLENKIMGNTNLSGYLSHILKDIAELIGRDEEDLSLQIFENSLKFFNQKI